MELYYHRTDGGAEYYTVKEDDLSTSAIRTDGDELEIKVANCKRLGIKVVLN